MINVVYFLGADLYQGVSVYDCILASINSLVRNRDIATDYSVRVYCSQEVPDSLMLDINDLSAIKCSVKSIRLPDKYSASTYADAMIGKLKTLDVAVNEFDRFVYLDSDTLVLSDIAELYYQDLDGNCVGGVEDFALVHTDKTRSRGYVNAGVLVVHSIPLKYELPDGFASLADACRTKEHYDQDVINESLHITNISWKYNCSPIKLYYEKTYDSHVFKSIKILHITGKKDFNNRQMLVRNPEIYEILKSNMVKRTEARSKVLIRRTCNAYGDWILLADCIYNANKLFPDILFDIEARAEDYSDILRICGCRFRLVKDPNPEDYTTVIDKLTYLDPSENRGMHLAISMFQNLLKALNISLSEKIAFSSTTCVIPSRRTYVVGEYVIVPSVEDIKPESQDKWYDKFPELVELLSKKFTVYELNTTTCQKTYPSTKGVICTDSFVDTAKLFREAAFVVCTENAVNHWACHNGGISFCLFNGSSKRPTGREVYYPNMAALNWTDFDSPERIVDFIEQSWIKFKRRKNEV